MKANLDNVATKLSSIINEYSSEVKEKAMNELEETANKIVDYIKSNCPKSDSGSNHLADSFIKTEVGNGLSKTIYISSSTKGRLVHLIELGFKHRSGVMVPARPFLRPAYETFTPKMLEDIRDIIGGKSWH